MLFVFLKILFVFLGVLKMFFLSKSPVSPSILFYFSKTFSPRQIRTLETLYINVIALFCPKSDIQEDFARFLKFNSYVV